MPQLTKEIIDRFCVFCKENDLPYHLDDTANFNWTLLNIYAEKKANGTALTAVDNIGDLDDVLDATNRLKREIEGAGEGLPKYLINALVAMLKGHTFRYGNQLYFRLHDTCDLIHTNTNPPDPNSFSLDEINSIIKEIAYLEASRQKAMGRVSNRGTADVKRHTFKPNLKPLVKGCVDSMEPYEMRVIEKYSTVCNFLLFAGFLDFMTETEKEDIARLDKQDKYDYIRGLLK